MWSERRAAVARFLSHTFATMSPFSGLLSSHSRLVHFHKRESRCGKRVSLLQAGSGVPAPSHLCKPQKDRYSVAINCIFSLTHQFSLGAICCALDPRTTFQGPLHQSSSISSLILSNFLSYWLLFSHLSTFKSNRCSLVLLAFWSTSRGWRSLCFPLSGFAPLVTCATSHLIASSSNHLDCYTDLFIVRQLSFACHSLPLNYISLHLNLCDNLILFKVSCTTTSRSHYHNQLKTLPRLKTAIFFKIKQSMLCIFYLCSTWHQFSLLNFYFLSIEPDLTWPVMALKITEVIYK